MSGIKKGIVLASLFLLALVATACNKDKTIAGEGATQETESEAFKIKADDGVYLSTINRVGEEDWDVGSAEFAFVKDEKAYFLITKINHDEGYYDSYLRTTDINTGEIVGEDILFEEGTPRSIMPAGDDAYIYVAACYSGSEFENWIIKCSLDGKTIYKKCFADITQISASSLTGRGLSFDGKYAYLTTSSKTVALDEEFNYVATVSDSGYYRACAGNNGLVYCPKDYSGAISVFDSAAKTVMGETIEIPKATDLFTGEGDELLAASSSSLISYNTETGEYYKLFDFMNVDIDAQNITYVYRGENNDIHVFYETYEPTENGAYSVPITYHAIVKRYAPDEAPPVEIIKIACFFVDYDLRKTVGEYNRSHEDTRIYVYNYYDNYTKSGDAISAFDRDIINGENFDIVMVGATGTVGKYASKGLFVDLQPIIESDTSFDLNDYYENILFAARGDDSLYAVTSAASIECFSADGTVFGDKETLSLKDITTARAEYPDIPFIGSANRNTLFFTLLDLDSRVYLGGKEGEYKFNTPEFKALLEFAASFPEWDDDRFNDYFLSYGSEKNIKDGTEKIRKCYLYGSQSYLEERAYFGKNFKLYGADSIDGSGYLIIPSTSYAISARSSHKEEAWEIIKLALNTKSSIGVAGFYANKDLLENELKKQYDACNTNQGMTLWVGNMSLNLSMTEEDCDYLRELVKKASVECTFDSTVSGIVGEEIQAYFAGEKGMDEVIKIIQKRVNLYLEEKK